MSCASSSSLTTPTVRVRVAGAKRTGSGVVSPSIVSALFTDASGPRRRPDSPAWRVIRTAAESTAAAPRIHAGGGGASWLGGAGTHPGRAERAMGGHNSKYEQQLRAHDVSGRGFSAPVHCNAP